MSYELISNARVDVEVIKGFNTGTNTPYCYPRITVADGRYVHNFEVGSKETEMLITQGADVLQRYLNGGHYFFIGDELATYRPSNYRGFIHDDEAIHRLVESLGINRYTQRSGAKGAYIKSSVITDKQSLMGGALGKFEMDIKSLGAGGNFDIGINGSWSPFSSNINTSLTVERLICLNGMVGQAEWVTRSVPMINDWERSLTLVRRRLEPEVHDILSKRFIDMSKSRASIGDVLKAEALLEKREKMISGKELTQEEVRQLDMLRQVLNVRQYTENVYQDNVFQSKELLGLSAHLTQYDLMNVLTETMSHIGHHEENNERLNKLANRLVFDGHNGNRNTQRFNSVKISSDSDHRRAFFGK